MRTAAVKRKPETNRYVWEELNAVVGSPRKPTPTDRRVGEEVPVARYPVAGGRDELHMQLPVQGHGEHEGAGGVAGHRRVYKRTSVEIDKGTTEGCHRYEAILRGEVAKTHSEACRQRITDAMEKDAELAKKVQAAEDKRTTAESTSG